MKKLIDLLNKLGFYRAADALENGGPIFTDTEKAVVQVLLAWSNGFIPLTTADECSNEWRKAEQLAIELVDSIIALEKAEKKLAEARTVFDGGKTFIKIDAVQAAKIIGLDREAMKKREAIRLDTEAMCHLAESLPLTVKDMFPLQKP